MNRRVLLSLTGAFLIALSALQLGSQSATATVAISAVPGWGQDGKIEGYVYGSDTSRISLYVFEFIPDLGWIAAPSCAPVQIQGTGQFSVDLSPSITNRYATRFSAYLVPSSLAVPCVQQAAIIPFIIEHNAISRASLPRLPQYQTISFGGLEWYTKTAPVQVYPGPQFFVQDNAYVDAFGQLHLKITQCSGSWCAAEVYTKQAVGYGTYQFTINSQLNNLDPNVTLGLFTWDAQADDQSNREWDIEFGRWGNPGASSNAQYVVQPFDGPSNLQKFVMGPFASSIHTVTWSANQVSFLSTANGSQISRWIYPNASLPVPTPGDVHLHLNLYVARGQAPATQIGQEIIIGNFQYIPAGPQVGFSHAVDNVPFLANSYIVPLVATAPGCTSVVESDSPWITVSNPNPVPAGGSLMYSVSDNLGGARTGNLILQSATCNATLGGQVLAVAQAGLVCTPSFAASSTHLGFVQNVRSVLVRGTASACTWTVTSSAPWLQIVSPPSGAGDGAVQFSADANSDQNLRQAWLALNNGQRHSVYQDSAGSSFALSPLVASPCANQQAQFAVSWIAPADVEVRLNSPTGTLVGQFGSSGTALLPQISDGTLVYLVQSGVQSVLASARATVLSPNCTGPAIAPLGIVNAAGYSAVSLSPGSLASVFGSNLSSSTAQASGSLPTSLGGISVMLAGEQCPLSYVSPSQINFLVPSDIAPGRYVLTIGLATSDVILTPVSPAIFTLKGDGTGVPIASVIGWLNDGSSVSLPPYQCDNTGCRVVPIVLPANLTDLYIVLYGTGIKNFRNISAAVGPIAAEVVFAGAQSQYPGLDQVNLHLKQTTGLTGNQSLRLQVDGVSSNTVGLQFR
ncbi:MAG: hypothetical protein LAP87_09765 [Acidobacteriia bacterium]|nr:hypothetical protein [Terriglobia bacterium]